MTHLWELVTNGHQSVTNNNLVMLIPLLTLPFCFDPRYFYIQTRFLEHIDLMKFFPGFVIAHTMQYCQVCPKSIT